jgi:hypothetical protein
VPDWQAKPLLTQSRLLLVLRDPVALENHADLDTSAAHLTHRDRRTVTGVRHIWMFERLPCVRLAVVGKQLMESPELESRATEWTLERACLAA